MTELNVQQANQTFLQTKYQVAEKIRAEDWNSIVFADGIGDEYFANWNALMEYVEDCRDDGDDTDDLIPVYVFATKKQTLQCDSILDLIENELSDFYDGAYSDLDTYYTEEINEVNQALKKFCQQL
jgi:hypothetical protein